MSVRELTIKYEVKLKKRVCKIISSSSATIEHPMSTFMTLYAVPTRSTTTLDAEIYRVSYKEIILIKGAGDIPETPPD